MQNKPFNIAFFGSSLVSSYWNGAATYYRGIIKYLNRKGHQITFYEPDAFDRQKNRDMDNPDWCRVNVYEATENAIYRVLKEAANADIIIKASGVGVFDELLEREILKLKKNTNKIIFWDVDAPATLDRIKNNNKDQFHALIPQYDFILTYGGGEPVVDTYLTFGATNCFPVYNALDPETHFPTEAQHRYISDLAFLGNRLPDREQRVDEFFINPAAQLPQLKFLLGGSGWHDKLLPENIIFTGHVGTNDHNAFNCTPKAVLNISRQSMADYGFSPATRVFEAAGAGACIITDYWLGIEQFLIPEEEILVARDGNEVIEIMQTLTVDKAKAIGKRALKKILQEHTYAHRVEQLEKILNLHDVTIKEELNL